MKKFLSRLKVAFRVLQADELVFMHTTKGDNTIYCIALATPITLAKCATAFVQVSSIIVDTENAVNEANDIINAN